MRCPHFSHTGRLFHAPLGQSSLILRPGVGEEEKKRERKTQEKRSVALFHTYSFTGNHKQWDRTYILLYSCWRSGSPSSWMFSRGSVWSARSRSPWSPAAWIHLWTHVRKRLWLRRSLSQEICQILRIFGLGALWSKVFMCTGKRMGNKRFLWPRHSVVLKLFSY